MFWQLHDLEAKEAIKKAKRMVIKAEFEEVEKKTKNKPVSSSKKRTKRVVSTGSNLTDVEVCEKQSFHPSSGAEKQKVIAACHNSKN